MKLCLLCEVDNEKRARRNVEMDEKARQSMKSKRHRYPPFLQYSVWVSCCGKRSDLLGLVEGFVQCTIEFKPSRHFCPQTNPAPPIKALRFPHQLPKSRRKGHCSPTTARRLVWGVFTHPRSVTKHRTNPMRTAGSRASRRRIRRSAPGNFPPGDGLRRTRKCGPIFDIVAVFGHSSGAIGAFFLALSARRNIVVGAGAGVAKTRVAAKRTKM